MSITTISVTRPVATPSPQLVGDALTFPYDQNGPMTQLDTSDWSHDPLEAMARDLGPYTVVDMEMYLDNFIVDGWCGDQ